MNDKNTNYEEACNKFDETYSDTFNYLNDLEERDKLVKEEKEKEEEKSGVNKVQLQPLTNVVTGKVHRKVQMDTLNLLKDYLSKTFGPMGSYTKIITGNDQANIASYYSKDGLRVLKSISSTGPIEMSIIEELIESTRYVEKQVGDGTTSSVILSAIIFEYLMQIQDRYNIPPFQLIDKFKKVVDEIKDEILKCSIECTPDMVYEISMISTNGNEEVSNNLEYIYNKFGMNVDISVGISNSEDSYTRDYDGLTITEGMSDPVYINNHAEGTCTIPNAHVYYFKDPIDTVEMIDFFEAIIQRNIYDPIADDEDPIPTVITCPKMTRDLSTVLKTLANQLYQIDQQDEKAKPPILIITNVLASDEVIMNDIANLCGCKEIAKYIDPKVRQKDVEEGKAPTLENIQDFYGLCDCIVADSKKTKFINPSKMHHYDENGNKVDDPIYTSLINFLETEIENEKGESSSNDIGLLKKRLNALKANGVDYLVGGVTIAERDAKKDLIEDAVKNCRSAAESGVGMAANYEGLRCSFDVLSKYIERGKNGECSDIDVEIARIIFLAYSDITDILYSSVCTDEEEVKLHTMRSISNGAPYNIKDGILPSVENSDSSVKCSIMLDINILDTIAKIITIMVTSNQCLLQAPNLNNYR